MRGLISSSKYRTIIASVACIALVSLGVYLGGKIAVVLISFGTSLLTTIILNRYGHLKIF